MVGISTPWPPLTMIAGVTDRLCMEIPPGGAAAVYVTPFEQVIGNSWALGGFVGAANAVPPNNPSPTTTPAANTSRFMHITPSSDARHAGCPGGHPRLSKLVESEAQPKVSFRSRPQRAPCRLSGVGPLPPRWMAARQRVVRGRGRPLPTIHAAPGVILNVARLPYRGGTSRTYCKLAPRRGTITGVNSIRQPTDMSVVIE